MTLALITTLFLAAGCGGGGDAPDNTSMLNTLDTPHQLAEAEEAEGL